LGRNRFVEEARRNKLEGHKLKVEADRTGIILFSLSKKKILAVSILKMCFKNMISHLL